MGTCFRIIISWKPDDSLLPDIRKCFSDSSLGDLVVRDVESGDGFYYFTWCEHDDEDYALREIAKRISFLMDKGVEFGLCCFERLYDYAMATYDIGDFTRDVFERLSVVSLTDISGLRRLYEDFGYEPINLDEEVREELYCIEYYVLPSGEKSPYFCRKDGKVFFSSMQITGADADSFCIIDSFYAKDTASVYYRDKRLDADPETAVSAGFCYLKDKDCVFFLDEKIDADPLSFRILSRGFSKDDKHVFYKSDILDADPDSFVVIEGPEIVGRDESYVYLPGRFRIAVSGDWKLFARTKSNQLVSADSRHIFVDDYPILDIGNVEVLGNFMNRIIVLPSGVFFFREDESKEGFDRYFSRVPGADPVSFREVSPEYYADSAHEYYISHGVKVLGPERGLRMVGNYAVDSDHVYYDGKVIEGVEPASFEPVGTGGWHSDGKVAVWAGWTFPEIDAGNFDQIEGAYYTDGNVVTFGMSEVVGADPDSFVVENHPFYSARDKNHYYDGSKVITDPVVLDRIKRD